MRVIETGAESTVLRQLTGWVDFQIQERALAGAVLEVESALEMVAAGKAGIRPVHSLRRVDQAVRSVRRRDDDVLAHERTQGLEIEPATAVLRDPHRDDDITTLADVEMRATASCVGIQAVGVSVALVARAHLVGARSAGKKQRGAGYNRQYNCHERTDHSENPLAANEAKAIYADIEAQAPRGGKYLRKVAGQLPNAMPLPLSFRTGSRPAGHCAAATVSPDGRA